MSLDGRFLDRGRVLGNHRNRRQPAAQPSRWTRAHSTSGHTFPFGNSAGPAKKAEAPPVGLAKKRRSERGGRAWTGAFTFPSCPLFCSRSKKRIFPRSKLVPSAIKGVRLRAPTHERRRPWGVRMASLGLPKSRRRDQGSAQRLRGQAPSPLCCEATGRPPHHTRPQCPGEEVRRACQGLAFVFF